MCNLLLQMPAEHQHAATRALGHLVGHAPITPECSCTMVCSVSYRCGAGKRHLGRQAALELKTLGLFALGSSLDADICTRRWFVAVPHALLRSRTRRRTHRAAFIDACTIATAPQAALTTRPAVAFIGRSRYAAIHVCTKSNEEDVRSSGPGLCFIAARPMLASWATTGMSRRLAAWTSSMQVKPLPPQACRLLSTNSTRSYKCRRRRWRGPRQSSRGAAASAQHAVARSC